MILAIAIPNDSHGGTCIRSSVWLIRPTTASYQTDPDKCRKCFVTFWSKALLMVHNPMAIPSGPLMAAVIPKLFLTPIMAGPIVGIHPAQFNHGPAVF